MLGDLSRSRAMLGFSPSETATFIFSLKQPLFDRLRKEVGNDVQALADEVWTATTMLDNLGLYTMQVFQKSREEIIQRQQQEMLELSTPVTQLWDGILAIPLIGTLDSERTQVVMESLLQQIVETGAAIAIICCHRGFHSEAGAEGVGRAATRAFVASFIAILVLDFFLAMLLNNLHDRLWPSAGGRLL